MTIEQTKKLIFHNDGEIHPVSWEMIGVSAKSTDNPIGQFGSGLCFAIAGILRLGGKISIKAGEQLYEFGVTTMEFRGKSFERVTCNGENLQFSTDMGKHWEPWMFYREIVSNYMDEGGLHYVGEPMEQGTSVIVECEEITKCMENHESYFLGDREPIYSSDRTRIFQGNGTIWYRGVKVGNVENALHSYEILYSLTLTEDRTISGHNTVNYPVVRTIVEMTDKKLIRKIITCGKQAWEHDLDYDWTWGEEFLEVVRNTWETAPTTLNTNIARLLRSKLPDIGFIDLENHDYQPDIDAAKNFLAASGYIVDAEIRVIQNNDEGNVAFVANGVIHLTERAFEKGLFYLTSTLLEEHFHTKGYDDRSISYEQMLIDRILHHCKKHTKLTL